MDVRLLDAVGWVVRTAAVLAVAVLAGCGSGRGRAHARAPARAITPAAPAPPLGPSAAPAPPLGTPAAPASLPPARPPARGGIRTRWQLSPDAPLPRRSRWWPVLDVARRFAAADMSYEVGDLTPAVRRTLVETCTAGFAAQLLSRRPTLPPGVHAGRVRQKLVGVVPLEHFRDAAVVLATVRPAARPGPAGAFELRLVPRAGGWRVDGLIVV